MNTIVLAGLLLQFIGAAGLTYEFGFSRVVYSPLYYEGDRPRYMPLKRKNGTYIRIGEITHEVIVTSSFIIICIGFLLQFIGYVLGWN